MNNDQLHNIIKQIIQTELKNKNILNGQWHLGVVDSIIDSKKLSVFVDGSTTAQTIPCDPDRTYQVGDEVWVVFINGNPRNKQVMGRRPV